uniref:Peroxidase n=1 Tax=Hordeum vulgare subsp. vulgare TaxID=112509 RepID=A0A8I7BJL5_HORVV
MAAFTTRPAAFLGLAVVLCALAGPATAQRLSPNFYSRSCPNLASIVRSGMTSALQTERRMGASILRLFFHDCFVNGCDGSILLDDTSTLTGEKNAGPNANSARGFDVIDAIKTRVEAACRATVSCADILSAANANLPGPGSSLATLIAMFGNKNLSPRDMTALSGAHTIGRSQCQFFRSRIYNERNINATFAALRQRTCPRSGGGSSLAPLDAQTADGFDNAYYRNLVGQRGLLHSDQELFNGGSQDSLVRQYSSSPGQFSADFVTAMLKMGGLLPSPGTRTEVRLNCRRPN